VSPPWCQPWVQQTDVVCPTHNPRVATPWCETVSQPRGARPCRNSKTGRNLADVARRTVRHPPRVVIRGRHAPCAELACCVRRRPRVAIVVQTVGGGLVSQPRGARPWCNDSVVIRGGPGQYALFLRRVSVLRPAPSSRRNRWFKPGGNSRWQPGGWMCQYPYGKNAGAGRGSNPGGNDSVVTEDAPPNSNNSMKGRRFI
jgi:hypothetical protein